MSTILITGGAGFIGSSVAKEMLAIGHDVVVLDHKKTPASIDSINEDITDIEGDVRNPKLVKEMFTTHSPDGVIHLAAVSRVVWGEQNPGLCKETNVQGLSNVFEAIRVAGIKPWLIFGSSREVYGEPASLPVKENFPKQPMNVYGRTKLEGEQMVHSFSKEHRLASHILRFSNVYGNEHDILDRVIPRFVLAGLRGECLEIHGGGQLVDFTHISDTVAGIRSSARYLDSFVNNGGAGKLYCEDLHLLPGRGCTLQQVVETIMDYLDTRLDVNLTEPRNYDVKRFVGCPSKAKDILDFQAKISIEEGIEQTIDCYREAFGL